MLTFILFRRQIKYNCFRLSFKVRRSSSHRRDRMVSHLPYQELSLESGPWPPFARVNQGRTWLLLLLLLRGFRNCLEASGWILYVIPQQPHPSEESGVTARQTCRTRLQRNTSKTSVGKHRPDVTTIILIQVCFNAAKRI